MQVERATGELFGKLWSAYDDESFKQSVLLFEQRWRANGEDPAAFRGQRCIDVGCGGGRYSIAMALLGAREVVGVDVGREGLSDARRRAAALGMAHVTFEEASALELPFADGSFDFACCSGVLHHTRSVERGLRELHRVLRPGGRCYLLLYGSGGLYWPLNLVTRSFAGVLGVAEVDRAIAAAGFSAAKRRTILDDLFVPILETYTADRVDTLLREAGFTSAHRWQGGQLDHESDPATLVRELEQRAELWTAGARTAPPQFQRIEQHLADIANATIATARELIAAQLPAEQLRRAILGEGHHRIVASR
jgi:ubiquinone/menaquinone biosynthesis C-methylase UbiE